MIFDPPIPIERFVRLMKVFPDDAVLHAVGASRIYVQSPDGTVYGWIEPDGMYVKTYPTPEG